MFADPFQRGLELPIAIDRHGRPCCGIVQHVASTGDSASKPGGGNRSRASELEEQQLVGATAPMLLRPSRQMTAGDQPRLVIVRPEIGRPGMRNVDGDDRNARLVISGGNRGRDSFVGLKLDGEIDALTD